MRCLQTEAPALEAAKQRLDPPAKSVIRQRRLPIADHDQVIAGKAHPRHTDLLPQTRPQTGERLLLLVGTAAEQPVRSLALASAVGNTRVALEAQPIGETLRR